VGSTTVEYEFTDTEGNSSSCIFNVNVIDESEIVISNCPEDIILRAENNSGTANVSWEEPTASSECSEISVNSSHESGGHFEVGTTIVTYSFTTESGQRADCLFEVTVEPVLLEISFNKLMTPNGDGNNDSWIIDGIENFPDNEVIVVDRWGTEIFSEKGYNNDEVVWSGENKGGELVPRGTYYYFISVRNDQDGIERKGFLEVLR
jgi:gliding motility-associated-like protein